MPAPVIKPFPEKSASLAEALATQVIELQDAAIRDHDEFIVAVSGGSLVATMEKAFVGHEKIIWNKWKIFFADERIVPLDDPDSNYNLLKENFLEKLASNTKTGVPTVFAIDPSISPSDSVARSYEVTLNSAIPYTNTVMINPVSKETKSVPRFDLILLGCGPDGHTCSLFPGHELNRVYDRIVAFIDDSPKPPSSRVTITKPVLQGAGDIIFVAEGEGKQEAMKRIFVDKDQDLPAAVVNDLAKNPVTWIVSESAVEGVDIKNLLSKS